MKILDQMHVIDLTGKSDQEMIDIITNAGKKAEKWDDAKENLLLKSLDSKERKSKNSKDEFRVSKKYDKTWKDKKDKKIKKDREFKDKRESPGPTKPEGISEQELLRRRKDKECLRCAWPSDRKGKHCSRDCQRPIKLDAGTASFPKGKEYQKMRIGALEFEIGEEDEFSLESESKKLRDTASEETSSEGSESSESGSCETTSSESENSDSLGDDWWN
jgi:hypothetical protein